MPEKLRPAGGCGLLKASTLKVKMGYHPKTNIVKDETGDVFAHSHSIMARCRNHFSQLLNVHRVNDVWQPKTYAVKLLTPESSAF